MDFVSNIDFSNLIPYCIFPNSFLRNKKLSTQQKVLFELFCSYDHIDKDGHRKGWCDPSLDTIADQMGLTKRSVQVHLKRLIEAGMVVVVYRNTEMCADMPRSSIYILNILPGLSEADRFRISAARTIEIKHLISGLNTIKVQTATGMHYTTQEEFDLELLVTGSRSSEVLEGEIVDGEDIITKQQEVSIDGSELYGFNSERTDRQSTSNSSEYESNDFSGPDQESEPVISFGPNRAAERRAARSGFDSVDANSRIRAGNFKGVTGRILCQYFKFVYEEHFSGEHYTIDSVKEISVLNLKIAKNEIDVFVPMMEFFIKNYNKLFSSKDFPRPRIYQLSIPWIWDKLEKSFNDYEKAKNEVTVNQTRDKSKTILI